MSYEPNPEWRTYEFRGGTASFEHTTETVSFQGRSYDIHFASITPDVEHAARLSAQTSVRGTIRFNKDES